MIQHHEINILLSARPGDRSFESDSLQSGVFSCCFCDLLKPRYNCRTLEQIYQTLQSELPRLCNTIGCDTQAPFGYFIPDEARYWILALSKVLPRLTDRDKHALEVQVEIGKIQLYQQQTVVLRLEDIVLSDGRQPLTQVVVTPSKFREACRPLIQQLSSCIGRCIEQGKVWGNFDGRIDIVMIAGQAGRMRSVLNLLEEKFPKAEMVTEFAECAVARGLALWVGKTPFVMYVEDISYYYVGISVRNRDGNHLYLNREALNHRSEKIERNIEWLIYPDDTVPGQFSRYVHWNDSQPIKIEIYSKSLGKHAEYFY
jgi:hypothetical protein